MDEVNGVACRCNPSSPSTNYTKVFQIFFHVVNPNFVAEDALNLQVVSLSPSSNALVRPPANPRTQKKQTHYSIYHDFEFTTLVTNSIRVPKVIDTSRSTNRLYLPVSHSFFVRVFAINLMDSAVLRTLFSNTKRHR